MAKKRSGKPPYKQPSGAQKTPMLKYVGRGKDEDRARLLEGIPDAFLSVDSQWQITHVNRQAEFANMLDMSFLPLERV